MATDDYADLPEWVRPGNAAWIISWADTSAMRSAHRATIGRILKRDIVVTYAVRGNTVEQRIPRDSHDLNTRRGQGGGATLCSLDADDVLHLRAVTAVRNVPVLVERTAAGYGHSVTRGADKKPLNTITDAAAMLDDLQAVLDRARAQLARLDTYGALAQEGV